VSNEMDGNTQIGAPDSTQGKGARTKSRAGQRSIDQRLAAAQLIITVAASDEAIQELLDPYGFGFERITQEGRQLLLQVRLCLGEQAIATGDKHRAKDERDRLYAEARSLFIRHKALARVALGDDRGAIDCLDLQEPLRRDRVGLLAQARQFYSAALSTPALQLRLAEVSLTVGTLEGGRALVEQLDHCAMLQSATRSAAQEATRRRNAAVRRLDAWMADFRTIARMALREHPLLLGKLGL
jgi:hypothetical protein